MRSRVHRIRVTPLIVCLLSAWLLFSCSPQPQEATPAVTALPGEPPSDPAPTGTPEAEVEQEPVVVPTDTPTPTPVPPQAVDTPVPEPSYCQDLSGSLEVQIMIGPAEAVGLEPFGVGSIPFTVAGGQPPNPVQGGGGIDYQDVLVEEWGSYDVSFVANLTLSGDCAEAGGVEQLNLTVEMSGEQTVEVTAQGFHGVYPWSGSHAQSFTLPFEEGATYAGEGFAFILHVNA